MTRKASPGSRAYGSGTARRPGIRSCALWSPGGTASLDLATGRYAWVQVARGSVLLNATTLREGDGAAASTETRLGFAAADDGAELLAFDLA